MDQQNEPLLMSVSEAAAFLGLPKGRLYELAEAKKITHVKIGGSLKFTRKGLEGWVDEQTVWSPLASSQKGLRLIRNRTRRGSP